MIRFNPINGTDNYLKSDRFFFFNLNWIPPLYEDEQGIDCSDLVAFGFNPIRSDHITIFMRISPKYHKKKRQYNISFILSCKKKNHYFEMIIFILISKINNNFFFLLIYTNKWKDFFSFGIIFRIFLNEKISKKLCFFIVILL